MPRNVLYAALAVALMTPPLPAATAAAAANDGASADDRDSQVVCRRERQPTLGSRLKGPRLCQTRAQWRELEEYTQRELQQIRDGQAPLEPLPSVLQVLDREVIPPN